MLLGVEGQSSPVVGDDTQPMRMEVKVSDVESSDWDNILGDKESDVQRRENMVGLEVSFFLWDCVVVKLKRRERCGVSLHCAVPVHRPTLPSRCSFRSTNRPGKDKPAL